MGSPIEVLSGNIIHAFENADESALSLHKKVTASGLVAKQIDYDNGCEKVKTPHADIKTREIYLQETYLSHLWSFIYSVFIIYEEGVKKPLINQTFKGKIEFSSPILKRAKLLYDWSISLADKYSEWDKALPNPRNHHSEQERFYAEKINSIFQTSVAYVMFHEFAHLTHGHESYFLGSKLCEMTDIEFTDRIQIENEADEYAFNMIVKKQR